MSLLLARNLRKFLEKSSAIQLSVKNQGRSEILYNDLILKGKLFDHLREIEETANRRLEQMMKELLEKNPAPDKKMHQMEWVQHMNALKAQAEEVILNELINS